MDPENWGSNYAEPQAVYECKRRGMRFVTFLITIAFREPLSAHLKDVFISNGYDLLPRRWLQDPFVLEHQ
jgi:hypothetical protein